MFRRKKSKSTDQPNNPSASTQQAPPTKTQAYQPTRADPPLPTPAFQPTPAHAAAQAAAPPVSKPTASAPAPAPTREDDRPVSAGENEKEVAGNTTSEPVSAIEATEVPMTPEKALPKLPSHEAEPTEEIKTTPIQEPGTSSADGVASATQPDTPASPTPTPVPETATTPSTAAAEQTHTNGENRVTRISSGSDEKIPVMSEPPTVAPVKVAPGMVATSGPLEDYPEYTP